MEKGTQIANDTAESLVKVVESTQTVSGIVDRIAEAAAEQSASIGQVNLGMEQIRVSGTIGQIFTGIEKPDSKHYPVSVLIVF